MLTYFLNSSTCGSGWSFVIHQNEVPLVMCTQSQKTIVIFSIFQKYSKYDEGVERRVFKTQIWVLKFKLTLYRIKAMQVNDILKAVENTIVVRCCDNDLIISTWWSTHSFHFATDWPRTPTTHSSASTKSLKTIETIKKSSSRRRAAFVTPNPHMTVVRGSLFSSNLFHNVLITEVEALLFCWESYSV